MWRHIQLFSPAWRLLQNGNNLEEDGWVRQSIDSYEEIAINELDFEKRAVWTQTYENLAFLNFYKQDVNKA